MVQFLVANRREGYTEQGLDWSRNGGHDEIESSLRNGARLRVSCVRLLPPLGVANDGRTDACEDCFLPWTVLDFLSLWAEAGAFLLPFFRVFVEIIGG